MEETEVQKAKRMLINGGDYWTIEELGFNDIFSFHMDIKTTYQNGKYYYCGLEILEDHKNIL